MLTNKKFLFFSAFTILFSGLLFIFLFEKRALAATENDFSFNLHAFYNFGGNLFSNTTTEEFQRYIDNKICDLNGFYSLDSCREKANGTEIIRLSGKTGIITQKVRNEQCQNNDRPPCFNDSPNPFGKWTLIDSIVRHATSLGLEIMMELSLWERWWDNNSIAYIRDLADVDNMLKLGEKAIKRYDGNCDINEDGDCNDNVEETQENPSTIYPKIKYWQVGNEPGNNKWTFNEKTLVNGKEVLLLAYATNQFAKKLKTHCSDCKIVLAGVAGDSRPDYYRRFIYDTVSYPGDCNDNNCEDVRGYYRKLVRDLKYLKLAEGLEVANFDVFDFHHHHHQPLEHTSWSNIKFKYDIIKKLLEEEGFPTIPIWMTETTTWTGSPTGEPWISEPYPKRTEEDQAGELIKRFVYSYFLGIKKVFWSSLIDSPYGDNDTGYFANVGLLKINGDKKISFDTFKLMISKMKNFQTVEKIDVGNQDTYLFKFNFGSEKSPFLVFWKENGDIQLNLLGKINPYLAASVINLKGEETGETIYNITGKVFPKFIEPFPCPKGSQGDIDCDNQIGTNDINIIKDIWAPYENIMDIIIAKPNKPKYLPDLNNDGLVDEKDLTFILKNFGK